MPGNIVYGNFKAECLQVGSWPSSYTYIDKNGDMFARGGAVTYDDLPPYPIIVAKLGVSAPTLVDVFAGFQRYAFAVNDLASVDAEYTHRFANGQPLAVHMHWATQGTDVVNKYIRWQIRWTLQNANEGAAFPALQTLDSGDILIPANTPHATYFISGVGTVSMPTPTIGGYLMMEIKRIASVGAAPSNNPFGLSVGVHGMQDTLGSRGLYIK